MIEKMKMIENKSNFVVVRENIEETDTVVFSCFSYNSLIAQVEFNASKELKIVKKFFGYSQTTTKHLKQFINKYFIEDFYTTKKQFEIDIKKYDNIYFI